MFAFYCHQKHLAPMGASEANKNNTWPTLDALQTNDSHYLFTLNLWSRNF